MRVSACIEKSTNAFICFINLYMMSDRYETKINKHFYIWTITISTKPRVENGEILVKIPFFFMIGFTTILYNENITSIVVS